MKQAAKIRIEELNKLAEVLHGRVCILGVGNRYRGDDGAGSVLCDRLKPRVDVPCLDSGMAPENFLEQVVRLNPQVLLVLDAVHFSGKPGELRVLNPGELSLGGPSTHQMSIGMCCAYLMARIPVRVFCIAIQPSTIELGDRMSIEVEKAVDFLSVALPECLSETRLR